MVVIIVIIEVISIKDREHLCHWHLPSPRDRFIIIFLRNLVTRSCRHWNIAELLQFRVRIIILFVDLLYELQLQFLPSVRIGDLALIDIIWAWTLLLNCLLTFFGLVDIICEELLVGVGSFRNQTIIWIVIISLWTLRNCIPKTTRIQFLSICTTFAAKLIVHC